MEKVCTKCNSLKVLSDFTNMKRGKLGKSSWCKECHYTYKRENSKEYYREYAVEYRKKQEHKEWEENYRKQYKGSFRGTVSSMLAGAKNRAKGKGIEYDLDSEWLISKLKPMRCEATNSPLTLEIDKDVQHSPFRPSIDRVDNSIGYTKENCRVTCVIYNKAKSDGIDEDVLLMAKYLLKEL